MRWALALLLSASLTAQGQSTSPTPPLTPERVLQGLMLTTGNELPRTPLMLVEPSTMAGSGSQLIVFDRAQGQLIRIEPDLLRAQGLARGRALAEWRIRPTASTDILLIDPNESSIRQLSNSGVPRARFADLELTQPVDAAETLDGLGVIVADFDGRLHTFAPSGGRIRSSEALTERNVSPVALIRATHSYFLLDRECACIIELDSQGLPLRLIAEGQLQLATDVAADPYGRLWYLDSAGQTLHAILRSEQLEHYPLAALGVGSAASLTIDQGRLVIAERGTGRIHFFTIQPEASDRR